METRILPTFFSAANLMLFNKENEKTAKQVVGPLTLNPDLQALTDRTKEVTLTFVRDHFERGASAEINKAYSDDSTFPGPRYPLAIKKMHHSKIVDEDPDKTDFYELITREVVALQELCYGDNVSPCFTKYYGSFYYPEAEEHWLAFEYCIGGDISFLKRRPINLDFIAAIACGVLAGLEVLHDMGYIHADIKPDNVLLASPGILKICDFGLTAKVKDVETPEYHALGTTRYMSPELMLLNVYLDNRDPRSDGLKYDYGTDIWSLGIMLLEFLIGRCPLFQMRKTGKEEQIYCEYIKNMTKRKEHNTGSGLKQILVIRDAYRVEIEDNGRSAREDMSALVRRYPKLRTYKGNLLQVLDREHLKNRRIDPSRPVPKLNKTGLYRINLCIDFIAQCLICNAENRPTSKELKNHQFVKRACAELDVVLPNINDIQEKYASTRQRTLALDDFQTGLTIRQCYAMIKLREREQRQSLEKIPITSKFML